MTDKLLNIAVFGAGRIGNVHAKNIAEHSETRVKYIIDPYQPAADKLAHGVGATVAEEQIAFDDPEIDAILIGSQTHTHADLIERALQSNKAIFCEKPIDLDIDRVNQVLERLKQYPQTLLMGFNRRFDPGLLDMRQKIRANEIGAVELVTVISKDPSGGLNLEYLRSSGGMFRDMTIHDFDMARYMMGEEFISVYAEADALISPDIAAIGDVDTAIITLKTKSGKMACITNSRRASFGYDQRVEAHGSLGSVRTENIANNMTILETEAGTKRANPQFFFVERYAQSYKNEWAHFVDVIKKRAALNASADDGQKALLLANAAYQSLKTNKRIDINYTQIPEL